MEAEMGGIGGWWRPRLSRSIIRFGCSPTRNVGATGDGSTRGIRPRCPGQRVNTDAPRARYFAYRKCQFVLSDIAYMTRQQVLAIMLVVLMIGSSIAYSAAAFL